MQRLQALNVTVVDQDANTPDSSRPPSGPSRRRTMRNGGRSGREVGNRDSNVSSLLDEAVPPLDTSAAIPEPLDSNYQMERWRVKRRKLESDDNREGLQSFRYGHYGQVVPGALKMELASCDGGTYESERDSSWPENILHNDSSIYCTKSGQCNLILKHQGEAPFCLKRIVIKVPKMGYDTPVQEGMVFVSMSSDELLARTAQYQIQPRSGRQRRNRRSGLQPSQEYLNAYRTPLQTLERTGPAGAESHSESDTDINELAGSSADHRSLPRSEFRITTEYDERSEHSDNDEEDFSDSVYSSFANWLQMYQMEDDLLCSESDDSESDGDTPELTTYNRRRRDFQRQVRVMRRRYGMDQEDQSGRRPIPSVIQPTPSSTTAGQRTASDSHNPGSGLLKPHARFSIERTKSMVSVKFDPPPYVPPTMSVLLLSTEKHANCHPKLRTIHPYQVME
ncbi:hypothetical protein EYZ11_005813 [Aspergillus tanneri]|uniref:Uncharacterized protein n=1 Tax=Aspergillus tanneri TaxID=1220188 RepID=A0A4S3JHB3_9EURO|nr:hypothetical protein EYZ11_005813 [Aspergillus tanneri]